MDIAAKNEVYTRKTDWPTQNNQIFTLLSVAKS